MKIHRIIVSLILLLFVAEVYGEQKEEIQVTLLSDKQKYAIGEPIGLKYEVLWLGLEDAEIYFNRNAFPEIEILHLNRWMLELQESKVVKVRSVASRHEIRNYAPTMKGCSDTFVINSKPSPITFINGTKGYFLFDEIGTYVIRAKFDNESPWKLSDRQQGTIWSNSIVIEITS